MWGKIGIWCSFTAEEGERTVASKAPADDREQTRIVGFRSEILNFPTVNGEL
jgi:hypothetical protein